MSFWGKLRDSYRILRGTDVDRDFQFYLNGKKMTQIFDERPKKEKLRTTWFPDPIVFGEAPSSADMLRVKYEPNNREK